MQKLVGAALLAAIALFMLLGFLRSDAALGAPATLAALALAVGLPAAGAALLARSHFAGGARLRDRKALLRQQTIDAEILRLAREEHGRLTAVEVATQLGITPEAAKEALDALVLREQAELEITDAGVLVYRFHAIQHLGGKSTAKGILDA